MAVAAVAPPPEPRLIAATPDVEEIPATMRQPEPPVAMPAVNVDLGALERDGAQDAGFFHSHDLPPPPKNLFARERGTGTYRTTETETEPESFGRPAPKSAAAAASKSQQAGRFAARPPPSTRQVAGEPGRYAPARPAAIFGSMTKPQAQSLFSDDLVSDKSLDEVILSYLAEDLEPPRRK